MGEARTHAHAHGRAYRGKYPGRVSSHIHQPVPHMDDDEELAFARALGFDLAALRADTMQVGAMNSRCTYYHRVAAGWRPLCIVAELF